MISVPTRTAASASHPRLSPHRSRLGRRWALGILGVAALVLTGCSDAVRSPDGGFTEVGSIGSSDLVEGDCVNVPAAGSTEVGSMVAVPCSMTHEAQVYAVFDLEVPEESADEGERPGQPPIFPGVDVVSALADEQCLERFADAVGQPYEASEFEYASIYPLQSTWADGNRRVVCLAVAPGDGMIGELSNVTVAANPTPAS